MELKITYAPDGGDSEYRTIEHYGVPEDIVEKVIEAHEDLLNQAYDHSQTASFTYERTDDRKGALSVDLSRVADIMAYERQ